MPRSRRAASKEALKNLQLLSSSAYLDDEEERDEPYSVPSEDDDDDVIPVEEMPPKKKYRVSYRKLSADRDVIVLKTVRYNEETLQLDAWQEELSPAQLQFHSKIQKELNDMNIHLDQITKQTGAEVIFQGEETTVYQLGSNPPGLVYPSKAGQNVVLQTSKGNNPNSYQLLMDARLGLVVGTIVPTSNISNTQDQTSSQTQNVTPTVPKTTRNRRGKASLSSPLQSSVQQKTVTTKQVSSKASQQQPQVVVQPRPAETSAIGGLTTGHNTSTARNSDSTVVDLTSDDGRPVADSREISFNKLQGKTFPSLVVVARPHLRVKEIGQNERAKFDAKVKGVLMHAHTKFTEWLIQQGLVRSEQSCIIHPNSKLNLGMYSDVTKFPYSGGYVWISDCCPQRFVSVFSGSLFEGSPHPPSVILKLMYHWACQTNVQNVVQWVKVDNFYVKGMYTCLRAVCTVALHTHLVPLGGPGKKVEVGVISLGTTSQDGQQRQVKVEVLGLLEPEQKLIRLWSVEPLAEGDRNYKKRFSKILAPLVQWVHPESIIVTDLTVDKGTLHQMGFMYVQQSISSDLGLSNHAVMEYLRRIVPRMFQNTLSLLSRQIIQQFLDELVWREWFGPTAAQAFDSLVMHLAEQTRADTGNSLIVRLNKVAINPFKNWSIGNTIVQPSSSKSVEATPTPVSAASLKRTRQRGRLSTPTTPAVSSVVSIAPKPSVSPAVASTSAPISLDPVRPVRTHSPDIPERFVPLENYYYGTIHGKNSEPKGSWSVKCPVCHSFFGNNLKLMEHLFSHAHNVTGNVRQCRYCLSSVVTQEGLAKHIASSHPLETKFADGFVCLICEKRFPKSYALGKHMSKEHVPSELPYQCGTCGFRTSSHRLAIDHFYSFHDNGSTIQCPFCLKSTTVWSGRVLSQTLHHFLIHLQKHQKKTLAKKCSKCALWFVQKESLKEHQQKMHLSLRRKPGLVPDKHSRNALMVPKSKQDKQLWQENSDLTNLSVCVPNALLCKECKNQMTSKDHYKTAENCSSCEFTTCCHFAMKTHRDMCKDLKSSLPLHYLPSTMYCICGYNSYEGNMLAKHLAECEKKSAYPTEEAAKTAAVTHSMLDVLGLVRRPEERSSTAAVAKKQNMEAEVIDLDEEDESNEEVKTNDTQIKPSENEDKDEAKNDEIKETKNDEDGGKDDSENNIEQMEVDNTEKDAEASPAKIEEENTQDGSGKTEKDETETSMEILSDTQSTTKNDELEEEESQKKDNDENEKNCNATLENEKCLDDKEIDKESETKENEINNSTENNVEETTVVADETKNSEEVAPIPMEVE